MTMRRMVAMAGGAVAPIALLALLFNNQWVADAIRESGFDMSRGIGPLVAVFQFPSWRLTLGGHWQHLLAIDFTLLLFLVLLGLLVFGAARIVEPRQSLLGAIVTGWWATAVAGGAAGLVGGVLIAWAIDVPGPMMSRTIWSMIGNGANFGVMFGWIAGLGALGGSMVARPREGVQQPYGGRQPYGAPQPGAQMPRPGMPPQGAPQGMPPQGMPPQGVPPQGVPQQPMQPHPSAVPYVPPQGQPQQPPPWGGPAGPQQPGAPQQYGPPPVPQQPPAQQAPAQEAPQAPDQAQQPPAPEASEASEASERSGPERAGDGGEEPEGASPGGALPDIPEDDDLDLADRTVIDPRRDDD